MGLEEKFLDETFRHLMIRNHGMYTLFGVKPITHFSEEVVEIDRDKEMKEFLSFPIEKQKKYQAIKKKEYQQLPGYLKEKYSEEDVFFSDYHYSDLWEFWEAHWKEYTGARYFFLFEKTSDFGTLFVNVNEVLYLLNYYYDQFKSCAGGEFSADKVLEELKEGQSEFWSKAFSSDYLMGLLFGYGEKSAALHALASESKVSKFSYPIDFTKNGWNLHKAYLQIHDLSLPTYKLFSLYDEQLAIFQRERERIINFYANKDFVKQTLYLLGQQEGFLVDPLSGEVIPTLNELSR